jgi:hypothetical protein
MSVTYYVAMPFVRTEDGVAPGQAQEMPNEAAAIRRAEAMSRDVAYAGALAFKRSGDPGMGNFNDAIILKTSGDVPKQAGSTLKAAGQDFGQTQLRVEEK